MMGEVPARARELAARLAAVFRSDVEIVARLNDAQRRLLDANDRLWSGLHPVALGRVYDGAPRVAAGQDAIAGRVIATLRPRGGQREIESTLLEVLQQTHWAIRRAFVDYQSACEERRRLAVDVGELAGQLTEALIAVGGGRARRRRAQARRGWGAMIAAWRVPSWRPSTIRRRGGMTIPAPEPDPDSSERAGDAAAGRGDRPLPGGGGLQLVAAAARDDSLAVGAARRLRTAPPVQLELVSGRDGPGPEVVWASLPERARERVPVLLARPIDAGAVEREGGR
jgi:hypothetical protein